MPSLNKVMLIGRLGKDPEVKKVGDGEVCNFSVATSETWKDKRSGDRKEKTEWHNIVVWNENAINFADKYLKKGDLVYIEGQVQTRSWEKDDVKHYATEIVVPAFGGRVDSYQPRDDNDRDDDRGSRSRDRDDDRGSRSNSRSRDRDNDRDNDGDDRGSRGRGRDRDDDKSRDSKARDSKSSSSRGSSRRSSKDDLDDDIPF